LVYKLGIIIGFYDCGMKYLITKLDLVINQEKKRKNQRRNGFHIIKAVNIENGMEIWNM
jgi:hypothetical protein